MSIFCDVIIHKPLARKTYTMNVSIRIATYYKLSDTWADIGEMIDYLPIPAHTIITIATILELGQQHNKQIVDKLSLLRINQSNITYGKRQNLQIEIHLGK